MRLRLVALILLALAASATRAQETPPPDTTAAGGAMADGPVRRVVLLDGSAVVGVVDDEGADPLVVRLPNGVEQRVPRDQVREVADLYAGRFSRLDPNRSRLFLTPTSRTLGRGSGRFSTFLYILPGVAYGVTDAIDVSAAAAIPVDLGEFATVLNFNVKGRVLTLPSGGGVALGATALIPVGENVEGVGGTFYGVATLGSETSAVTLGAIGFYGTGLGLSDDGVDVARGAVLVAGFEQQLSNNVKFITENGLLVAGDGVLGFGTLTGVRFFSDRLTADVALAFVAADDNFELIPLPYLGFAYNFGR